MKNITNCGALCASLLLLLAPCVHAQNKQPYIGVGQMNASVPGMNPYNAQQLGNTFATMVETQLLETQKFHVIERAQLGQILGEKALGQSGVTGNNESVTNGGIQGVDYLVYGTITKLGQATQATHVGVPAFGRFGGFGGGGFSSANSEVSMAVDLRITDAHTGEIKYAGTVEEQIKSGSVVRVAGVGTGNQAADPLSDVERLTAKAIVAATTTSIYPIRIITQESDGSYVLNYGASVLTVGDELGVFRVGESFKDPDTGKILGADETRVGLLKVIDAESQFSKATLENGSAASGNIVKRLSSTQNASAPVKQGPSLP